MSRKGNLQFEIERVQGKNDQFQQIVKETEDFYKRVENDPVNITIGDVKHAVIGLSQIKQEIDNIYSSAEKNSGQLEFANLLGDALSRAEGQFEQIGVMFKSVSDDTRKYVTGLDDILSHLGDSNFGVKFLDIGKNFQSLQDQAEELYDRLKLIGKDTFQGGDFAIWKGSFDQGDLIERIDLIRQLKYVQEEMLEYDNSLKAKDFITGQSVSVLEDYVETHEKQLEILRRTGIETTRELERQRDDFTNKINYGSWDDYSYQNAKDNLDDKAFFESCLQDLKNFINEREDLLKSLDDGYEQYLFTDSEIYDLKDTLGNQLSNAKTQLKELGQLGNVGKNYDFTEVVDALKEIKDVINEIKLAFEPLTTALNTEGTAFSNMAKEGSASLDTLLDKLKELGTLMDSLNQKEFNFTNQTVLQQTINKQDDSLKSQKQEARNMVKAYEEVIKIYGHAGSEAQKLLQRQSGISSKSLMDFYKVFDAKSLLKGISDSKSGSKLAGYLDVLDDYREDIVKLAEAINKVKTEHFDETFDMSRLFPTQDDGKDSISQAATNVEGVLQSINSSREKMEQEFISLRKSLEDVFDFSTINPDYKHIESITDKIYSYFEELQTKIKALDFGVNVPEVNTGTIAGNKVADRIRNVYRDSQPVDLMSEADFIDAAAIDSATEINKEAQAAVEVKTEFTEASIAKEKFANANKEVRSSAETSVTALKDEANVAESVASSVQKATGRLEVSQDEIIKKYKEVYGGRDKVNTSLADKFNKILKDANVDASSITASFSEKTQTIGKGADKQVVSYDTIKLVAQYTDELGKANVLTREYEVSTGALIKQVGAFKEVKDSFDLSAAKTTAASQVAELEKRMGSFKIDLTDVKNALGNITDEASFKVFQGELDVVNQKIKEVKASLKSSKSLDPIVNSENMMANLETTVATYRENIKKLTGIEGFDKLDTALDTINKKLKEFKDAQAVGDGIKMASIVADINAEITKYNANLKLVTARYQENIRTANEAAKAEKQRVAEENATAKKSAQQSKLDLDLDQQISLLAKQQAQWEKNGQLTDEVRQKINTMVDSLIQVTNSSELIVWKKQWAILKNEVTTTKYEIEAAAKAQKQSIDAIEAERNNSGKYWDAMFKDSVSTIDGSKKNDELEKLNAYYREQEQLLERINKQNQNYGKSRFNTETRNYEKLMASIRAIDNESGLSNVFEMKINEYEQVYRRLEALRQKFASDSTAATDSNLTKEFQDAALEAEKIRKEIQNVVKEADKLSAIPDDMLLGVKNVSSIDDTKDAMKALANEVSNGTFKITGFNQSGTEMYGTLKTSAGAVEKLTVVLNEATGELVAFKDGTDKVSSAWNGVSNYLIGKAKQFAGMYLGFNDFIRYGQQGFQIIRDLDSAMTELKKVTDETDETYEKFLQTASQSAGNIGSTIKDFTTVASDFARLGYSIEDASKLAEVALVYENVGDGFSSVDEASESIISTMKAFGIEAENTMSIVDKFNEVGNNFAIDSKGIGDALQRSASALVEGGNSIDEAIALVTAANSVVQNPEQVGTALKTLTLRLRGAKVELEEAGLETDGMATSVSTLREKLLALTDGKVDIMTDENTFKNTTQILREMSKAWEDMTDIEQAAALELMGGKRQANILSSMITNFDTVEDVIETSSNSAGSALEENETHLQSIQGHIDVLTNSFQTMWKNAIDDGTITFFIDLANALVKIVDKVGLLNTAVGVLFATIAVKKKLEKQSPIRQLTDAIKNNTDAIRENKSEKEESEGASKKFAKSEKRKAKASDEAAASKTIEVEANDEVVESEKRKAKANDEAAASAFRQANSSDLVADANDEAADSAFREATSSDMASDADIGEATNSDLASASDFREATNSDLAGGADFREATNSDLASGADIREATSSDMASGADFIEATSSDLASGADSREAINSDLAAASEEAENIENIEAAVTEGAENAANAKVTVSEEAENAANIKAAATENAESAKNTASTMSTIMGVAGSALGGFAIGALISAVMTYIPKIIDGLVETKEEIIEAGEAAKNEIDSISDKLKSSGKFVSDYGERFAELSEGVDDISGKNISLSTEEYEEFLDLSYQLAELFPDLTTGYDENGNAMVNLAGNADTVANSLQNLLDVEKQLANKNIVAGIPSLIESIKVKEEEYRDEIADITEQRNNLSGEIQYVKDNFGINTKTGTIFVGNPFEYEHFTYDEILDIVERAADSIPGLSIGADLFPIGDNENTYSLQVLLYNGTEFKDLSDDKQQEVINKIYNKLLPLLDNYETEEALYNSKIELKEDAILDEWKTLIPSINAWLQTKSIYNNAPDEIQRGILSAIQNFSLETYKQYGTDFSTLSSYIENSILLPYSKYETDIQDTLAKISNIDPNSMSFQEYIDATYAIEKPIRDKLIEYNQHAGDSFKEMIYSTFYKQTRDLQDSIIKSMGYDLGTEAANNVRKYLDSLTIDDIERAANITKNYKVKDVDALQFAIDIGLNKSITMSDLDYETESKFIEKMQTAISESASETGLSLDSIDYIQNRYEDLYHDVLASNAVVSESGYYNPDVLFQRTSNGIRLNMKKLRQLEKAYRDVNLKKVNDDLKSLEEEYDTLTKLIEDCSDEEQKMYYRDRQSQILDEASALAEQAYQYKVLTSRYNQWQRALSSGNEKDMYENIVHGREAVEESIKSGWLTDEDRNYIELVSGIDLTDASNTDVKKLWKSLNENKINNTNYRLFDFFIKDEDGKVSTEGIYNFYDALHDIYGDKYVWFDDNNKMNFDFSDTNIKEIAEDMNTSEEVIEYLFRASSEVSGIDITWLNDSVNFYDNIDEQIKDAEAALDNFRDENGRLDLTLDGVEEAQKKLRDLLLLKYELEKPTFLKIDYSGVNESSTIAERALAKIAELYEAHMIFDMETSIGLESSIDYSQLWKLFGELKQIVIEDDDLTNKLSDILGVNILGIGTSEGPIPSDIMYKLQDQNTFKLLLELIPDNSQLLEDIPGMEEGIEEALITYGIDENSIINQEGIFDREGNITYSLRYGKSLNSIPLFGFYNGTAHAGGTAFAGGNWGAPRTEKALVGELGPEMVVRGNRWFTVGDNGAEFTDIKKGDVIFNHRQTEALLSKGYITGRGNAYASGTAYLETINADVVGGGTKDEKEYAGTIGNMLKSTFGSVLSFYDNDDSTVLGQVDREELEEKSGTTGSGSDKSGSDKKDPSTETIDFIEILLEEIEDKISKTTARIENIIDDTSQAVKKSAEYSKLIAQTKEKEKANSDAASFYNKKAEKALSEIPQEYKEKAKNGAIAIEDFVYEEDTDKQKQIADAINKYRDYASKADDAELAVLEAQAEIAQIRLDEFNDKADDYDNRIDSISLESDKINANIDLMEAQDEIPEASHYKKLIDLTVKTQNELTAKRTQMQKDLNDAVSKGDIKKGTDEWYEMVNAIAEVDEEIIQCKVDTEEYNNTIADNALKKFNKIADEFDNQIGLINNSKELLNSNMDLQEASGIRLSPKYYKELMAYSEAEKAQLLQKRDELQTLLNEKVEAGEIEKGDERWYEMVNAIAEVDEGIVQCDIDTEEYQNTINDLKWDNFDKLIEKFDNIDSELSHLNDRLTDGDTFDEEGNWTSEGIAAMGVLSQQMEVAQAKSQQYAQAIEELNRDYKNGLYSVDEYNEKLAELKEGQWDSIEAYEDAKDAIVDLNKARIDAVKDGLEKEIDAYKELIDKQKEALDSEKDLHDFEKSIADKEQEIAKIKRKIAALSGDTSASAAAKRKQLQEELLEAEADLEETYYDRSIEKQKEALDKSYEAFEEEKDAEMEKLDEYLKDEDQVLADSLDLVKGNAATVLREINDVSKTYGIGISDAITNPWVSGTDAISGYKDSFTDMTSSFAEELEYVAAQEQKLTDFADEAAKAVINSVNATAKETTAANKIEKPKKEEPKKEEPKKEEPKKEEPKKEEPKKEEPKPTSNTYTVKKGDTLWDVAKEILGDPLKWKDIYNANKDIIKDPNKIYVGQKLTIPITEKQEEKKTSKTPSKGDTVIVDTDATHFSANSGNKKMANFVPGGTYTVYQVSDNQVLIGKNGVSTGWVNVKDLNGYAKGTIGVKNDQFAWIDELGEELVLHADGSGRLSYLSKGTSVIPADLTSKLMDLALDPTQTLEYSRPIANIAHVTNNEINVDMSFGSVVNIEHVDQNDIPNLTKAVEKQMDNYMKKLNSQIRKYSR